MNKPPKNPTEILWDIVGRSGDPRPVAEVLPFKEAATPSPIEADKAFQEIVDMSTEELRASLVKDGFTEQELDEELAKIKQTVEECRAFPKNQPS